MIQQLGLLPFLINMQTIDLSLQLRGSRAVLSMSPPLASLQSSLRTLSTVCGRCPLKLAVELHDVPADGEAVAANFLGHCLAPFTAYPDLSLSIHNTRVHAIGHTGQSQSGEMQFASDMFARIAAHLRFFSATGVDWLFCDYGTYILTQVKEMSLKLNKDQEHSQEQLRRLCRMLNGSAELHTLSLHVPGAWRGNVAAPESERLICERLQHLRLDDGSLRYFLSVLGSLSCSDVSIALDSSDADDWTRILTILRDPQYWQSLRKLQIHLICPDDEYYPWDAPAFHLLSDAAKARSVELGLTFRADGVPSAAEDLIACLRDLQGELTEVYWTWPRVIDCAVAFQPGNPIVLSRCTILSWEVFDELEFSMSATSDVAFTALMVLLQAPIATVIHLEAFSPHTGYLTAVTEALDRGAFPKVKKIEGRLRIEQTEWEEDYVGNNRKKEFLATCKTLGISTSGCVWR